MHKKLSLNNRKNCCKRYKKIGWIIVTAFVIILFVTTGKYFISNFIFQIKDSVKAFMSGTENGFPCEIEGGKVSSKNINTLNGNIVISSDKFFESFNLSGNKISCRPHNLSNPIMKSCGSRAILYDVGGNGYSIETCSENILKENSECKILCADISKNGIYGLITESPYYLSKMSVFNPDKTEKYKYNFADFYVCGFSVKTDGSGAAICGNTSVNGEINSFIYVFNFSKKDPVITYNIQNQMIISVNYISNKNLLAIGDKSIIFIDTLRNEKKEINYTPKLLKSIHIDKNFGVIYCIASKCEDKEAKLILTDINGKIKFEKDIENSVDRILRYENKILCAKDKTLFIYDILGKFKNKIYMDGSSTEILKISSSEAVILKNKILEKINIF